MTWLTAELESLAGDWNGSVDLPIFLVVLVHKNDRPSIGVQDFINKPDMVAEITGTV